MHFIYSLINTGKDQAPRQMTMDLVLERISIAKSDMDQETYYPNLFVGSGKGGALCAAVFASQLGHHLLKVVDRPFGGEGEIDFSSLQPDHIRGKNVLVVEWARKSGRTYKSIRDTINQMNPAGLRGYALFWTKEGEPPDYYGATCKHVPQNPWGTY